MSDPILKHAERKASRTTIYVIIASLVISFAIHYTCKPEPANEPTLEELVKRLDSVEHTHKPPYENNSEQRR